MSWRVAFALDELRKQATLAWPNRSRISDGTIGDLAHQNRTSDHNPWVPPPRGGVVTALDLTHDPANGADMHKLTEAVKNDPRIKYVIWNRRIWNPSISASWRNYTGSNPHTSHAHFSVKATAALYDSRARWALPAGDVRDEPFELDQEDCMRRGHTDRNAVVRLQQRLNLEATVQPKVTADGIFGAGTENAVKQLQKHFGYVETGVYDLALSDRLDLLDRARRDEALKSELLAAIGAIQPSVPQPAGVSETRVGQMIDQALGGLRVTRA